MKAKPVYKQKVAIFHSFTLYLQDIEEILAVLNNFDNQGVEIEFDRYMYENLNDLRKLDIGPQSRLELSTSTYPQIAVAMNTSSVLVILIEDNPAALGVLEQ